ncbi:MAG: HAMP domain-containing protein [Magnetococcales bacterium]|nr:HAMP domain-containing protein [Magnetococcales bacterium]
MTIFPSRIGIQFKLFAYFMLIICLALGIGGVVIETLLVSNRFEAIRQDLLRQLRTIELMITNMATGGTEESYSDLAQRLGTVLEMRVTIINTHGQVLGDSSIDRQHLLQVENHLHRPEVIAAMTAQTGTATRHSSTVNADLFYMAYKIAQGDRQLIVRLARPLHDLQQEITQLRQLVLGSLLLAMLLAVVMSLIAAHLATKPLRGLVAQAQKIAEGHPRKPLVVAAKDEIGGLADSFNCMLTQLEQSMDLVALERDRLRAVLEGILDAVVAVDASGHISLVNHAALTLFALDTAPIATHLSTLLPEDQLQGLLPPYLGDVCQKEITLTHLGEKRLQVSCACTKSDQGCIMLLRDITEKYRVQQMQREFVANASHELRTPVSIIRLNAETLMDDVEAEDEQSHFLLEGIFRQSLRLSKLVADLLDLSRLESGNMRFQPEPTAIRSMADQIVHSLHPLCREKNIQFDNQIDESLRLLVDPSALEQVLTNLFSNAFTYVPLAGQVILRLGAADPGWICLQVVDNGPGIPAAHHPRLFNRFYRIDSGRSREAGGTGLGLTIVKHLVESMHGKVGLHAVVPHGCCFWFTLPTELA